MDVKEYEQNVGLGGEKVVVGVIGSWYRVESGLGLEEVGSRGG